MPQLRFIASNINSQFFLEVQRESSIHKHVRELSGELFALEKGASQTLGCPVLQRIVYDLLIFGLAAEEETICRYDEFSRNLWRSVHVCWFFSEAKFVLEDLSIS